MRSKKECKKHVSEKDFGLVNGIEKYIRSGLVGEPKFPEGDLHSHFQRKGYF